MKKNKRGKKKGTTEKYKLNKIKIKTKEKQ